MNKLEPHQLEDYIDNLNDLGWKAIKNRIRKVITPQEYDIFNCLDSLWGKSHARADLHDFEHDLYVIDLWNIWHKQKGLCAVTKTPLSIVPGGPRYKNPWKVSIDRIDSSRGYVKDNIRLVTHWYNNAKNTWDDRVVKEAFDHWRKAYET